MAEKPLKYISFNVRTDCLDVEVVFCFVSQDIIFVLIGVQVVRVLVY